jgi:heme/copper-type cytochrome/quinol oxidase subunit 4
MVNVILIIAMGVVGSYYVIHDCQENINNQVQP